VARGVVARSVAALSKRPNRLLGYVENMSGYYCRDCNGVKPLFTSDSFDFAQGRPFDAAQGTHSALTVPCLGTVPFDPELARHCDLGMPFTDLRETPVGQALDRIAQRLLTELECDSERTK
jgi:hypothetical protein